jgi:hypothetical protein
LHNRFYRRCFSCFYVGRNALSKAQIGETQSDRLLREFGQRILDYRQTHGGTSPQQLSDLASSDEVDSEKNIQHLMDTYIENPIFSFALPSKPTSRVLVFEKSDLWSDGSIGACFDDLTVKRLSGVNNAYNTLDGVLLHDWTSANATLKGKVQSNTLSYVYTGGVGVQLQYNYGSQAHPAYYYRDVFTNGSNGTTPVSNYHESMSMYARTETDAAGTGAIEGAVNTDINMQAYFPGSSAHSPQFDYDLSDNSGGTLQFYKDVLTQFNFQ